MSTINPNIPTVPDAVGLLEAIQRIQTELGTRLPWLQKSFGRAYLMAEKIKVQQAVVPKVYAGKGEYYNVLPNDFLKSYSFMQVLGPEKAKDYSTGELQTGFEVKLAIVFYLNLKKIEPAFDHIFTDLLKKDALQVLKRYCPSFELETIQDEKIRDIFEGYREGFKYANVEDKLLMYPNAAMKFTGTLHYTEPC